MTTPINRAEPRHSYAQRRYWDADDALYAFETPLYHYAATGFPSGGDKIFGPEWQARRAQLEYNVDHARRILTHSLARTTLHQVRQPT